MVEACFAHVGVLSKRFGARLGLEEDRKGLTGSDEKGDEHEKESDRCCLIVGYVMMGHSHIADEVIKDGIKKMIAEYLD